MAAEMGLLRLVTPYVGASLPMWASIIALVLVALALGAWLGGRHSRGTRITRSLWILLTATGLLLAVLPLPLRALLGVMIRVQGAGFVLSGVTFLILSGIPLLLAGAVAPLLVQARATAVGGGESPAESPGSAAGLVTAGSTVGSLLGTLVPAFLTLPLLGTSRTFLLAAAPLLLAALWIHRVARIPGGVKPGVTALVLLLLGGSLAPMTVVPRRAHTIATAESAHHHIVVTRAPSGRVNLLLDSGLAVQSYYDPSGRSVFGPWPVMAAAPLLVKGARDSNPRTVPWKVFMVGMGGGTTARMLVKRFPRAQVVGAELDGEILRIAKKYMALSNPRIRAVVGDGRRILYRQPDASQDVILVDAAHRLLVPFHAVTTEMFQLARRKLRPGGVVVLNLVTFARDDRLLDAIAHTGRRSFAHVYRLRVQGSVNSLVVFSDHPIHRSQLRRKVAVLHPPHFAGFLRWNFSALRPWRSSGPTPRMLTDDRAAVAPSILSMLWHHVWGNDGR